MSDLATLGSGLDWARRALARLDDSERAELDRTWHTRAACRDVSVDVFFPVGDGENARGTTYASARAICQRCDVRKLCLALHLDERFGCFGATSPKERLTLRRQRGELGRVACA